MTNAYTSVHSEPYPSLTAPIHFTEVLSQPLSLPPPLYLPNLMVYLMACGKHTHSVDSTEATGDLAMQRACYAFGGRRRCAHICTSCVWQALPQNMTEPTN